MKLGGALLLAVAGLAIFFGVTRWMGTQGLLHYLPLEKRPEVLADRNVFHFRGDNALSSIPELCDRVTCGSAERLATQAWIFD